MEIEVRKLLRIWSYEDDPTSREYFLRVLRFCTWELYDEKNITDLDFYFNPTIDLRKKAKEQALATLQALKFDSCHEELIAIWNNIIDTTNNSIAFGKGDYRVKLVTIIEMIGFQYIRKGYGGKEKFKQLFEIIVADTLGCS